MVLERTDLVLGAGQLFFDRFAPGTRIGQGEMFFGNATEFSVSRDVSSRKKIGSAFGLKYVERSYDLEEGQTFRVVTDHISIDNISMWSGGEVDLSHQDALEAVTETINIRKGRYYQLGLTIRPILGLRNIDYLEFRRGGIRITFEDNFDIDKENGRFKVQANAVDVLDADAIDVTFQMRESTRGTFVRSQRPSVEGALRFVSDNTYGPNKTYYFPFVKLSPGRDISLLQSSQWQVLDFVGDAYQIDPTIPRMLVETSSNVGMTRDEISIIEIGDVSLREFLLVEDILDRVVNTEMPNDFALGA